MATMEKTEAHDTSSGGALYLIIIQVVSRGFTFIGNQVLLQYLSPSHLGLAIQLEALSVSVLYTARESLRVALQRQPRRGQAAGTSDQNAVNAGYLVILLGALLASICMPWYARSAKDEVLNSQDFRRAFIAYALATGVELVSEPFFLVVQQHGLFKARARAETTAAITRCVAACLSAAYMYNRRLPLSVFPFAVGQVCYATSLLLTYLSSADKVAHQMQFSILPRRTKTKEGTGPDAQTLLPKPLLKLATAFYGQSIFKWLLTQGDTLVLSFFADLQAQGIFALASNYGGLLSRLLFQPIEESSRNVFGKLLSPGPPASTSDVKRPQVNRQASTVSIHSVNAALSHLTTTLHAYFLLIALPAMTILPTLFPLLIQVLLGPNSSWSSTSTFELLSAYAYYIPILAVNGLLDTFVTSVASEAELGIQSLMMIGVTAIYLGAAWVGLRVLDLGSVGLVYANCLGMVLRIIFSLFFIREWLVGNASDGEGRFRRLLKESLPSWSCLSISAVVSGMLQKREMVKAFMPSSLNAEIPLFRGVNLYDVSLIISGAVLIVSAMLATESEFLIRLIEPLVPGSLRPVVNRVKAGLGRDVKPKTN